MLSNPEKKVVATVLKLAFLLYIGFFILDLTIYPHIKFQLLTIRLIVIAILIALHTALYKKESISLTWIAILFFIPLSFGISLMCFLSKEGFTSPYFTGNLLVMTAGSFFIRIKKTHFNLIMAWICIQHFGLLAFLPFNFQGFMLNLFFLASSAILAITVHHSVLQLTEEITSLKGLLPICMYCKKIRDDSGYWNQLETYVISKVEDISFSHGICPDCKDKWEEEIDSKNNK